MIWLSRELLLSLGFSSFALLVVKSSSCLLLSVGCSACIPGINVCGLIIESGNLDIVWLTFRALFTVRMCLILVMKKALNEDILLSLYPRKRILLRLEYRSLSRIMPVEAWSFVKSTS